MKKGTLIVVFLACMGLNYVATPFLGMAEMGGGFLGGFAEFGEFAAEQNQQNLGRPVSNEQQEFTSDLKTISFSTGIISGIIYIIVNGIFLFCLLKDQTWKKLSMGVPLLAAFSIGTVLDVFDWSLFFLASVFYLAAFITLLMSEEQELPVQQ